MLSKILPTEVKTFKDSGNFSTPSKCIRKEGPLFRCKKCRQILACQAAVLPHAAGSADVSWTNLVNSETELAVRKECKNGIFVEPLKWMDKALVSMGDKLKCDKCGAKLGSFSWTNSISCSCGTKFSPGFLINLNRVDRCTMLKEIEANV